MPGPNAILDKGYYVDAATSQFKAQKLASTKEHVTQAGAGELVVGIVQETVSSQDVTDGRAANVRTWGISRAIAGAAVAINDRVCAGATGKLIPATAATAKQNQVGIALTAAAADGDHFDVLLTPGVQIDVA